jgi:hypothetical protein
VQVLPPAWLSALNDEAQNWCATQTVTAVEAPTHLIVLYFEKGLSAMQMGPLAAAVQVQKQLHPLLPASEVDF